MPELPEVETVRIGLQRWVVGRTVAAAEVNHPRAVRRHIGGGADFADRVRGARIAAACRRGKYLWLPLAQPDGSPRGEAIVAHLGMSGQLLTSPPQAPDPAHLHVRIRFADEGGELRFVDQRTFGGLFVDCLVPAADSADADLLPAVISHVARDPLDPRFDPAGFVTRLRRRHSAVKRALLDQTLTSGIGNIYADEALWRARTNGARLADTLRPAQAEQLLGAAREVLVEALRAGGTSFDSLYVDTDGAAGWFERELNAYGRRGEPCPRCGTPIRREAFMNRSSFFCPRCQPVPRQSRAGRGAVPDGPGGV